MPISNASDALRRDLLARMRASGTRLLPTDATSVAMEIIDDLLLSGDGLRQLIDEVFHRPDDLTARRAVSAWDRARGGSP